jgi:RNA polymerase subunit RPABC4/transcription elongation factor Spt4
MLKRQCDKCKKFMNKGTIFYKVCKSEITPSQSKSA